jgi:biopolymer transport protein ExbD
MFYGIQNEFRHIKNNSMDIQTVENNKTRRTIHPAVRIDMTPMVDLGFLLITFFIFTTTMSEPNTMKLYMPHEGDPTAIEDGKVLTILLGNNNRVYAYQGAFEKALLKNTILSTNYDETDGIGNLIRQKQMQLEQTGVKNSKDGLVYLIKPTKQSTYKNIIDALDEAIINGVKKYMIIDASIEETQVFRE